MRFRIPGHIKYVLIPSLVLTFVLIIAAICFTLQYIQSKPTEQKQAATVEPLAPELTPNYYIEKAKNSNDKNKFANYDEELSNSEWIVYQWPGKDGFISSNKGSLKFARCDDRCATGTLEFGKKKLDFSFRSGTFTIESKKLIGASGFQKNALEQLLKDNDTFSINTEVVLNKTGNVAAFFGHQYNKPLTGVYWLLIRK